MVSLSFKRILVVSVIIGGFFFWGAGLVFAATVSDLLADTTGVTNLSDSPTGKTGVTNLSDSPATGGTNATLPQLGPKSIPILIAKIADFLITLAIPLAVLMIIWAGFMFVTAQGDTSKISKAKKNLLYTIIGVLVILASKVLVVYIQEALTGGKSRANALLGSIRNTLNTIVELLFVLATVYFFWGVVSYIRGTGNEEALKVGKRHMIWGIVGMTVMLGAWGIVNLIANYVQ